MVHFLNPYRLDLGTHAVWPPQTNTSLRNFNRDQIQFQLQGKIPLAKLDPMRLEGGS